MEYRCWGVVLFVGKIIVINIYIPTRSLYSQEWHAATQHQSMVAKDNAITSPQLLLHYTHI